MSTDHNARVVDQFSQQAEGYRQLTSSLPSDRSAALRAQIGAGPEDRLLELCCGPGSLALDFAPTVRHVTGLDLTAAMLEQARIHQAQRGVDNVEWVLGDACEMPFDDGQFSIVLCSAAFHHLVDPARVFGQMVRVCSGGGRIVVRDVTPSPDKSERYDATEKLRDPSHTHALSVDELRALGSQWPLDEISLQTTPTTHLGFDAILATSFPQQCSREDLHALLRADALSGEDRLGFKAAVIDGELKVSYPMSTAIWTKRQGGMTKEA
jgi:ubiquinone/menaquinone biosynthesis C-methylase UbiE